MEATENSRLTSLMMLDASRVRGEAGPIVGVHRAGPDERGDRVGDGRGGDRLSERVIEVGKRSPDTFAAQNSDDVAVQAQEGAPCAPSRDHSLGRHGSTDRPMLQNSMARSIASIDPSGASHPPSTDP